MAASGPLLPSGLAAGALKGPGSFSRGTAALKRAAAGSSSPGPRSRLQFLLEIAQATFSQPGRPTAQQIEALRRTLSQVPLEELGFLQQQQQESSSSSSSRSCSPGLSEGTHAHLASSSHGGASSLPPADTQQPRPPITYLLIYEDSRVSMGIFCLPARAKIPLHNHPGMTVLSRVLYGQMHVSSYDWLEGEAAEGAPLPRAARVVVNASLTDASPPVVLFPHAGGNIHEFTALTDCAVLDLMSPPYSTDDGRDCTYYTVLPGTAPQGDPAVVLLDSFDPPLDFVIKEGEYRGVIPKLKVIRSQGASQQHSPAGSHSTTTAEQSSKQQQCQQAPVAQVGSPVGSPRSVATVHSRGDELSKLLDASGGPVNRLPLPHKSAGAVDNTNGS